MILPKFLYHADQTNLHTKSWQKQPANETTIYTQPDWNEKEKENKQTVIWRKMAKEERTTSPSTSWASASSLIVFLVPPKATVICQGEKP